MNNVIKLQRLDTALLGQTLEHGHKPCKFTNIFTFTFVKVGKIYAVTIPSQI
jgi:hypothetical protein